MSQGISLHIGLNHLDNTRYRSNGKLSAPENDALAMADLAKCESYDRITLLLSAEATYANVRLQLDACCSQLLPGDTFLLTYSGHGGSVIDIDGDEDDGRDETWCLYDQPMIDDDFLGYWRKIPPGVRVTVVSASCHSRTAIRPDQPLPFGGNTIQPLTWRQRPSKRPPISIYPFDSQIRASILHLSACKDSQEAADGDDLTKFTGLLIKQWDRGRFKGSYLDLVAEINRDAGYLQESAITVMGLNTDAHVHSPPFSLLTPKP